MTMTTKLKGCAVPFDIHTYRAVGVKFSDELLRERITQTAFDEALASDDEAFALVNHRWETKIGCTTNRSLRLFKTTDGLSFELDIEANAKRYIALVRCGLISGISVGLTLQDWRYDTLQRETIRTVTAARIREISLLFFPHEAAYPGTWARVIKSEDDRMENRIETASYPLYRAPGDHVKVRTFDAIWEEGKRRLAEKDRARPAQIDLLRRRLELEDA